MTVSFIGGGGDPPRRLTDLPEGETLGDVLKTLGLSSQAYIGAIDGAIVPTDTVVQDGDDVTLIRAVSGG